MNKGQLYPGRAALVLNLLFILSASSLGSVVWAQAPEKNFRDDFAGASLRPEWNLTIMTRIGGILSMMII